MYTRKKSNETNLRSYNLKTTVSTLAEFTAAANASGPYVIVLDAALEGAAKVHVASDKSIIGLPGSSTFCTKLTESSPRGRRDHLANPPLPVRQASRASA